MQIQLRLLKKEWDLQQENWRISLSVLLFSNKGIPIVNKDAVIKIDGKIATTITTDETGEAVTDYIDIPKDTNEVHADVFVFNSKGAFAGNDAILVTRPNNPDEICNKNISRKDHLSGKIKVSDLMMLDGCVAKDVILAIHDLKKGCNLSVEVYQNNKFLGTRITDEKGGTFVKFAVTSEEVLEKGDFYGFLSTWRGEKSVTRDVFYNAKLEKRLRAFYVLCIRFAFRIKVTGQEFKGGVCFKFEDPQFHSSPHWLI